MSPEMAEFVLQVSDGRSADYVITASIGQSGAWFWYTLNEISAAVFTYDTLLTLSREVEHIWKPRPFFRLGTILYLVTRYPLLLIWATTLYFELANTSITDYKWYVHMPTHSANPDLGLHWLTDSDQFETILDTCQSNFTTAKRLSFQKTKISSRSNFKKIYSISHRLPSFVLTVTVTAAVTLKQVFKVDAKAQPPRPYYTSAERLDLWERHVRRDDCTLDQITLGTFRAATRRVHEVVMDEFGDTELIDSLQMRQR
ncbi:hypothetical protein BU17DRAFT_63228 [Hysterangium stoloniferum]|nr:hypothetical protein BU17DRAFT_63228 [Hysterangium stoloniferum]